jgi:hypothetical protein
MGPLFHIDRLNWTVECFTGSAPTYEKYREEVWRSFGIGRRPIREHRHHTDVVTKERYKGHEPYSRSRLVLPRLYLDIVPNYKDQEAEIYKVGFYIVYVRLAGKKHYNTGLLLSPFMARVGSFSTCRA